eukprot:TsM_000327100 transcript=TsM_000327100 gene=TsM_000327100
MNPDKPSYPPAPPVQMASNFVDKQNVEAVGYRNRPSNNPPEVDWVTLLTEKKEAMTSRTFPYLATAFNATMSSLEKADNQKLTVARCSQTKGNRGLTLIPLICKLRVRSHDMDWEGNPGLEVGTLFPNSAILQYQLKVDGGSSLYSGRQVLRSESVRTANLQHLE